MHYCWLYWQGRDVKLSISGIAIWTKFIIIIEKIGWKNKTKNGGLIFCRRIEGSVWARGFLLGIADDVEGAGSASTWRVAVAPRHLTGAYVKAFRKVHRSLVDADVEFQIVQESVFVVVFTLCNVFFHLWNASVGASAVRLDASIHFKTGFKVCLGISKALRFFGRADFVFATSNLFPCKVCLELWNSELFTQPVN